MAGESNLNKALTGSGDDKSRKEEFDDVINTLSAVDKRYAKLITSHENFEKLRTQLSKKYGIERMEEDLRNADLSKEEKAKIDQQLSEAKEAVMRHAADATLAYEMNAYKKASVGQKIEMQKNKAAALKSKREELDEKYAQEYAMAVGDKDLQDKLTQAHHEKQMELINQEREARDQALKMQNSAVGQHFDKLKSKFNTLKDDKSMKSAVNLAVELSNFDANAMASIAADQKKALELAEENLAAEEENLQKAIESGDKEAEQASRERMAELKKQRDAAKVGSLIADAVADTMGSKFDEAFANAEKILTDYKGHIDARLQGSEKSYDTVMDKISSNLSMSPFVKTEKVIDKMRELSDKGIAYNIEQRAFLSSISDKIANTFDAFDSSLTRLIRLQQADTTAARLGMEASLTRFLNNMFQDTSYLSDVYDSVSAAILDANATMSRNASAEFEYIVQKWLGALTSVGMSSDTITQIATGINYLATGDVTSLASNTQLQTLFAMSSSKAGLEYSELLLKGLDASSTNKLLESMVTYLKDIAENSDNQVVRSAYGDIFNLSMSDMKAISNLTSGDISNIAGSSLSYGGMMTELNNQFGQMIFRTSMSEMMSNMYNNAVFGVASDLVNSPATYSMYKMLKFMDQQKFDINIPFISAAGFGLDLNASVTDLMRMGLGVAYAFSLITNMFSGLGSGGGFNLDEWNASEYTSRGSGMSFSTGGVSGGTTGSTYVASGSSSDMKNSTLSSATDDAEETKQITNKNSDPGYTIDDIYKSVIKGSENDNWLRVEEKLLSSVYLDTADSFLHTQDGRMVFVGGDNGGLRVIDSTVDGTLIGIDDVLDDISLAIKNIFGQTSLVEGEQLKIVGTVSTSSGTELQVHDSKLDGTLNVKDNNSSNIHSYLQRVFGQSVSSLVDSNSRIKVTSYLGDASAVSVHDSKLDGTINVKDEGISNLRTTMSATQTVQVAGYTPAADAILSRIANAAAAKVQTSQTVNLGSGSTITIDKKVISAAFREALGLSAEKTNNNQEDTLASLVRMFNSGTAKVKVTNESGAHDRIYVDTPVGSTLHNILTELGN